MNIEFDKNISIGISYRFLSLVHGAGELKVVLKLTTLSIARHSYDDNLSKDEVPLLDQAVSLKHAYGGLKV
jgi:hypothetical protein